MKIGGFVENIYAAQVINEAKEAGEKLEQFRKLGMDEAKAVYDGSNLLERFAATTRGLPNEESVAQAVAELRSPEVLSKNISSQLCEAGVTPWAWKDATPVQRIEMMEKSLNVMAEQMKLPQSVSGRMKLTFGEMDKNSCNLFVEKNAVTGFSVSKETVPTIQMNNDLVYMDDIKEPLRQLYHQATLMMQQACCTEVPGTFAVPEMRAQWETELNNDIAGIRPQETGEMMTYARNMEPLFVKEYQKYAKAFGVRRKTISFK